MVVNDYACLLIKRGALKYIASELAPTGSGITYRVGHFYNRNTHVLTENKII
jgi:hypothetical protein